MKMPMITLPAIPTYFALVVLIFIRSNEENQEAANTVAEIILSLITYFAIYGLCTAFGL